MNNSCQLATAISVKAHDAEKKHHVEKQADAGKKESNANIYAAIFILFMESLTTRQTGLTVLAKELEENANIQQRYNDEDAKIRYTVCPVGANTATLNRVQNENANYDAMRENIQNYLITARQTGHVMMTEASSDTNTVEQISSEASFLLQSYVSMSDEINKISPGAAQ
ncbi:MAG: DUF720 domain-containing protein [Chlamydiales bacterium]